LFLSNVFTAFGFTAISIFTISQFWWVIFDIAASKNESHLQLQFMTEYFLDREKYFYLNLVHMNVAFFIGAIVMVAIGTTQIAYIQHTCGMFKIARYIDDEI
jgi:hypothetical protein